MANNAWAALTALSVMVVLGLSYQLSRQRGWYGRRMTLAFKGMTTLTAAMLALYVFFLTGELFALVLAAGLMLCAIADVVLEMRFHAGMALFASGHLAYMLSFFLRRTPGLLSLAVFLVTAGAAALLARSFRGKTGFNVMPYLAYALVIIAMLSLALSQPPLTFLGAALFAVSDALIARRLIKPEARSFDRTSITLYYSGQYLLALSALAQL